MKKDTLHFAHANGFPGGSYNILLSHFRKRYNVRAVDRIGHSEKYPIDNNWYNIADELIAEIESVNDTPVIGVGHSLGSILTFMAAYRRPELFKCVIMLDPVFFEGWFGLFFKIVKLSGFADRFTPAGKSSGRKRHWKDIDDINGYFNSRGLFKAFDPRSLDDYIEHAVVKSEDGYRLSYDVEREVQIFRTMPDNISSYRKMLPMPGAVIYGETSDAIHKRSLEKFTDRNRFNLRAAPGGHLFPLEKPDAAAAVIMEEIDNLLSEKR